MKLDLGLFRLRRYLPIPLTGLSRRQLFTEADYQLDLFPAKSAPWKDEVLNLLGLRQGLVCSHKEGRYQIVLQRSTDRQGDRLPPIRDLSPDGADSCRDRTRRSGRNLPARIATVKSLIAISFSKNANVAASRLKNTEVNEA